MDYNIQCPKCSSMEYHQHGTGPSVFKCDKCGTLFLKSDPDAMIKIQFNPLEW